MVKGDIILITFPFTNFSGSKLRPAIVLIENDLDITVCFITTQTTWQEETDFILKPNSTNGIKNSH
ncbi:type II toxin-antitoxin system PemK/MazF family toxin [Flavobacterium sp.]|uniref:type II toxin-antitoxin system PemK/MazF family toxin n=1 Tax=Flavobacterium sp. TaxID=239 RepID=UPI002620CB61|nr:type II toxin-antitoxin system PemK/MazF family toxin [Flavobacterium sp.]